MRNEHENPHCGETDELRNKAVRLFTYLKEVCQLRFVVRRDCRDYDHLLWLYDIPREPECFCIAWGGPTETNESWIEVRRSADAVTSNTRYRTIAILVSAKKSQNCNIRQFSVDTQDLNCLSFTRSRLKSEITRENPLGKIPAKVARLVA